VGTGFHPELTGRENIYLNGAILGMTRREIRAKFDEIVDFAEVEKFLDTPVKRYSSGMYVRLAFAVAAHLEPEILVVDEVLAVGDASFQKKCLGKMEDVAEREGRTVLFVSHNIQVLQALCNRGVLLEEGKVKCCEATQVAIGVYQSEFGYCESCYFKDWRGEVFQPGDSELKLIYIGAISGGQAGPLQDDLPLTINVLLRCGNGAAKKSIGLVIASLAGETAIHVDHLAARGLSKTLGAGFNYLTLEFPAGILKPGLYSVRVCGTEPMTSFHFDVENALLLEVVTRNGELLRHGVGAWKAPSGPGICKATAIQINPSECIALLKPA
jgi:lipopolysaccharide transport system ATP-binding protein